MQAPPQYTPPKPKNNTGLILGIIAGVFGFCCVLPGAGLAFFGLRAFGTVKPMIECQTSAALAANSIYTFAKENKGVMPAAVNWQDTVAKTYDATLAKNAELKQMPFKIQAITGDLGCRTEADVQESSFVYNLDVAGKKLEDVLKNPETVVLFEAPKTTRNASASYKPQDKGSAPKMMGQPRNWSVFTISDSKKVAIAEINASASQ